MSMHQLQSEVAAWSQHNFPRNTADSAFKGMVEEVGELSHSLLKREQGIRGTPEEHDAKIKDAIADLIIFTADFCARSGISMQQVVWDTWDQVKQRDWIKFPKNGKTE